LRVLTWSALGTRCEVQYAATSSAQAQAFETAAVAWVAAFEAKYSRFRPDSLISRINAAAGRAPVAIDAEMEGLLAL
jgi:thiamine biosynthesis lipoprotein